MSCTGCADEKAKAAAVPAWLVVAGLLVLVFILVKKLDLGPGGLFGLGR